MFADDIKLYKTIRNEEDARLLQLDINRLIEWCDINKLYLNEETCAIFTAKRTKKTINKLYMINNHPIERKEEIRDLAILLDAIFAFGAHIESITAHARQMIGYIKKIANGNFTTDTLKILYLAYVWHQNCSLAQLFGVPTKTYILTILSQYKNSFESRKTTTSYRLAPYSERCAQVNIQPLQVRRKIADELFVFDLYFNNIIDCDLNSKFIPARLTRTLRNTKLLEQTYYRTEYLNIQPISRMMNILNNRSNIIREPE